MAKKYNWLDKWYLEVIEYNGECFLSRGMSPSTREVLYKFNSPVFKAEAKVESARDNLVRLEITHKGLTFYGVTSCNLLVGIVNSPNFVDNVYKGYLGFIKRGNKILLEAIDEKDIPPSCLPLN